MAVTVVWRAQLKPDIRKLRGIHDEGVGATKAMAQAAGDLSHKVYLGGQDGRDYLGIDVWKDLDSFQKFAGDPKIQALFGQLFEGQPEMTIWSDSGWVQW